MAALASLEFEVLLKPASGEPITVGGFVVELECEVPEDGEAMVRAQVDKDMIAEGLRELAEALTAAGEEGEAAPVEG